MAKKNEVEVLNSIYFFDELENNRNMKNVLQTFNKMRAMGFISIGAVKTGERIDYSIHSQLKPSDLKQLLEDVIKKLPDGKAVVSLDGIG